MGMDLTGINTTAPEGEYFSASVWSWHPLADYLTHIAPGLMAHVEYLHSNDGDGLDGPDSIKLADVLDMEINSGRTQQYILERQAALDLLPDEECEHCNGSGVRNDKYVQGRCNACKGTGKIRPFVTWYSMDLDHVKEFATFVRHSGGFQIF